ncbi:hypothetical protein [Hellea balneolensis]|uniref:hypothetical protein n=1 Tax=Hellea balneolensis TaxID=287478 RepID=UPI000401A0B0|nr:hypothetical protein [Hellea balneolensis]
MKSRLIWMVVTGLALALILLVAVQTTSFLSSVPIFSGDVEISEPAEKSEPVTDTGFTPVIFRTVNEFGTGSSRLLRVNGTSEPNAVLILLNRNQRLRQIRADDAGNWALDVNVERDQTMVLELVMFVDGGLNVRGDETVFRVPVPPKDAEEIDLDKPALIMVTAPGGPTRIVQTPFGGSPTDGPLTMGPIDYDDSGGVIFSGTTEEEGRVRIFAGPSAIGETRVGAGGRWNFIAGNMLPLGEYEIAAELIKSDGVKARVSVPFERLPPSRNTELSFVPDIRYEPFRWQIRRQLLGGGAQYTAIFAPQEAEALIVD